MIAQGSWDWLIDLARRSAAYTGQRRFIIGQRWEQCGTHGWTYSVITADEHFRRRPERYR